MSDENTQDTEMPEENPVQPIGESMQTYIGTKLIDAIPMSRLDYNDLRGWELPDDEDGDDEGYLVEYHDGGQANHPDFEGYISWSPKGVFERAYEPTTGMTFGMAVEMMKKGFPVAREGWNGTDMFLMIVGGSVSDLPPGSAYHTILSNLYGEEYAMTKHAILPHIDMWTVNREGRRAFLPGWLASQSDILSSDWFLVETDLVTEEAVSE